MDQFIAAVIAAGRLGIRKVTYDAALGDLRIPVQFAGALLDLETPIKLGLGEDSPVSLSTAATGIVGVDIDAAFDLDLSHGGSKVAPATDLLLANAGIDRAVHDLSGGSTPGVFGV